MPKVVLRIVPSVVRLIMALFSATLVISAASAEDAVLLSSTAPGYQPGMVVLETDHLNVPDGASVTLLFQSGEVLRLGGPFEGTIQPARTDSSDTSASRLAEIFRAQGTDASVIGGTRSTSGRIYHAENDDVLVDPQRSGTYCLGPSASVWIARPDQDKASVALRRKGSSRQLTWPADAERIEWPADVPVDDGSQFDIEMAGKSRATVTFRSLPADFPGGSGRLAKGIILGCRDQFEADLRKAGLSIVPAEIWMTTDHGRHPKYRKGEHVALTVTASVDGYAYCVAEGADGSAMPIFPAGSIDGAQIRASMALTLPGRRQPNALVAGGDLRRVQCWLADRNLSAELPNALVSGPRRRLPERLAGDLDNIFANVAGTRVATSTLTIEVE